MRVLLDVSFIVHRQEAAPSYRNGSGNDGALLAAPKVVDGANVSASRRRLLVGGERLVMVVAPSAV